MCRYEGVVSLTLSDYRGLCAAITLDNGLPLDLEPWQCDVVADLLSGIPQLHVWVPEANGKTTLVAAINLIHLITHPSPRAVVAARNEKQAKLLYHQALAMVQATPELDRRLVIRDGTNEIRLKGRKGNVGLWVIPGDELSAHGALNTLVTVDEMHALPGLGLVRVLTGKMQKRPGAQFIGISTAGEPDSEFEVLRQGVLTGSPLIERRGPRCTRCAGPQHVAWNWALDPDDDIDDMDLVKLANPLGMITPVTLRAKRDQPTFEEKHWRTVTCNLPTRDYAMRFLQEGDWDGALEHGAIPEDVPVTYGADWGWTDDATAIVPLWRRPDNTLLMGAATVLDPPRNGTDLTPQEVLARFLELARRNPADTIAHDEGAYGGGKVMTGLLMEAFPETRIIPVTPKDANDAAGFFREQLRGGLLKHVDDPTLKRHLLNAVCVPSRDDPERFRIGRMKESRHAAHQRAVREIDAAVAAVLAVWGTVGVPPYVEPDFDFV